MSQAQLILVPCPGTGHIFAAVELANLLVGRDDRLSVAILTMRLPFDNMNHSFVEPIDPMRIQFIDIPQEDSFGDASSITSMLRSIESQKLNMARAVAELESHSASTPRRLVGFVLDMFCMSMTDVAEFFGVPLYMFFTCNAAFLGLLFYLQDQSDHHGKNMAEYKDSNEEVDFPGFIRPLPAKVLTALVLIDEMMDPILSLARRFRNTRGIIVNTFPELEERPLKFLCSETDIPKVYPMGPILNIRGVDDDIKKDQGTDEVLKWLDEQPFVRAEKTEHGIRELMSEGEGDVRDQPECDQGRGGSSYSAAGEFISDMLLEGTNPHRKQTPFHFHQRPLGSYRTK